MTCAVQTNLAEPGRMIGFLAFQGVRGSILMPNAARHAGFGGPLPLSGICYPQNDFRRVLERNPLGGHPTVTRLYRKQTPARLNRFINHVETSLNDSIAGAANDIE
jgi:hypothetical protein